MVSQFPTKTFPNHYSIVTGLYPESHGIVANQFYDPTSDSVFSYTNGTAIKESHWWGGEPVLGDAFVRFILLGSLLYLVDLQIWVTAVKSGKRSAICFWPGSEAEIAGFRPSIYLPYTAAASMSTNDRIDLVLKWLALNGTEKIDLIAVYFSLVDSNGHYYGPMSSQVRIIIFPNISSHLFPFQGR